jgi:hypothetical protein
MHKEWIQDTRVEFLGGMTQLGEENAMGAYVVSTSVSDIEVRTQPGDAEGTFTARNLGVGVSLAHRFGQNIRAGITGKYLYEKIFVDEASGFAVDLGVQADTPIEHLKAALTFSNLGGVYIFPESRTYLNVGTEAVISRLVSVRVGYQFGSESRGLSAGLGLAYGVLALDYAYARLTSDLGNAHTISLAVNL